MKFLVDNQLPPSLARLISEDLGADAWHVMDVGLRDGSDAEVWAHASLNDMVLISKDEDFVTLYFKTPSARLLWVRLGNCRRVVLLTAFKDQWHKIMERFESGETFVEFR